MASDTENEKSLGLAARLFSPIKNFVYSNNTYDSNDGVSRSNMKSVLGGFIKINQGFIKNSDQEKDVTLKSRQIKLSGLFHRTESYGKTDESGKPILTWSLTKVTGFEPRVSEPSRGSEASLPGATGSRQEPKRDRFADEFNDLGRSNLSTVRMAATSSTRLGREVQTERSSAEGLVPRPPIRRLQDGLAIIHATAAMATPYNYAQPPTNLSSNLSRPQTPIQRAPSPLKEMTNASEAYKRSSIAERGDREHERDRGGRV